MALHGVTPTKAELNCYFHVKINPQVVKFSMDSSDINNKYIAETDFGFLHRFMDCLWIRIIGIALPKDWHVAVE